MTSRCGTPYFAVLTYKTSHSIPWLLIKPRLLTFPPFWSGQHHLLFTFSNRDHSKQGMLYYFPSSSRSERDNRIRPILDLLSKRHRPQAPAQTKIDVHVHDRRTRVRTSMGETRSIDDFPYTCTAHELMLKKEECTSLPQQVGVREEDSADRPGKLAFGVGPGPKPLKSVLRKQPSLGSSSQSSSLSKSVTWAMSDQMSSLTLDTIDSFEGALSLLNDSESVPEPALEVPVHRNHYDHGMFFL
jgi:hypothetical protein